jgi:hypothetical protein
MQPRAIIDGGDLLFAQRNGLPETEQIRFTIAPCVFGGGLRPIERAFRAGHPMRALIEEVIRAKAVPEVIE